MPQWVEYVVRVLSGKRRRPVVREEQYQDTRPPAPTSALLIVMPPVQAYGQATLAELVNVAAIEIRDITEAQLSCIAMPDSLCMQCASDLSVVLASPGVSTWGSDNLVTPEALYTRMVRDGRPAPLLIVMSEHVIRALLNAAGCYEAAMAKYRLLSDRVIGAQVHPLALMLKVTGDTIQLALAQ